MIIILSQFRGSSLDMCNIDSPAWICDSALRIFIKVTALYKTAIVKILYRSKIIRLQQTFSFVFVHRSVCGVSKEVRV